MIKNLLTKVALGLLKRKLAKKSREEISNKFITSSMNFCFVMPEDTAYFEDAFEIVKYFKIHKKKCTLLLLETSYSKVSDEGIKLIPYNKLGATKLGLPGKKIAEQFSDTEFDVFVNLNINSDIFLLGLCALINAKFVIGHWGDMLPECYNFMIKTNEINPEIYYRNLLNSLQMF